MRSVKTVQMMSCAVTVRFVSRAEAEKEITAQTVACAKCVLSMSAPAAMDVQNAHTYVPNAVKNVQTVQRLNCVSSVEYALTA